ncbi:hypothetical protein LEN26_000952 [Aphanomyces euteiches]|nr:hypothetical protein LEN26_000952 [Aphanomyces euteiches]
MDDGSSSKAIRASARKEVEKRDTAFSNSSRWIDSEEYERLATMTAREKEEELRLSQPLIQLYKPTTKVWNPPTKVPLHKRKIPDLDLPKSLKQFSPAPPSRPAMASSRPTRQRELKIRSITENKQPSCQVPVPSSCGPRFESIDSLRDANKDIYAALVARFRYNKHIASPVKSSSLNDIHTIEDAVLYFLIEKHKKNVLYFQPEKQKPDQPYRPYDLTRIEPLTHNNKEEHFLMSASNLVHYKANENVECIPVAEWVYHSHMFDHLLKGIPLFQQLLRRRMFTNWNLNVRMSLYRESPFCRALRDVRSASTSITQFFQVRGEPISNKAMTLSEWNRVQELRVGDLETRLIDAKATVNTALHMLVQSIRDASSPDDVLEQLENTDMYKMRQAYPEWKSIPIAILKKFRSTNVEQVEQAQHDIKLLPSLFRLIQYIFTESLYSMVLESTNLIYQQFSTAEGSSITVAVSFTLHDAGGMVLTPTESDVLHHSMQVVSRLVALFNSYSNERHIEDYLSPSELNSLSIERITLFGMRLVDLLKIDSCFHLGVQKIRTAVKTAYHKVASQVNSFEALRPIYRSLHDPGQALPSIDNISNYSSDLSNLLTTIHSRIGRLDMWQHQCHKTQTSWSIGFMEIHCRHIITELLDKINSERNNAHQLLEDLTTRGILHCVTALKDAIALLDERPQVNDNEKHLFQDIKMVEEAFKALRACCPHAAANCIGQFNLIHALQAKYALSYQANLKFSKKMLPVIAQQVSQILQRLTTQCKRILTALENNVTVRNAQNTMTGKTDFESKLNSLNEIKSELDSISQSSSMYIEYQQIMGIRVTPVSLLEVARSLWSEVHDVWKLCQEWRMAHAVMHAHKFVVQSWTKNQTTTKEFLVRAESIKCRYENKIFIAIKTELHAFLRQLDLTVELGAPYIKQLHWEQIFKTLGADLNIQTFSLKQLNDLDIWSHADKVRNITYHARVDAETEVQLNAMKAKWAAAELICKGLELDQVSVDELLASLDDDLVQVQLLMQKTSQPALYEALVNWSNEINYTQDTLELWVSAQIDWLKLDHIFQLPDIQQSVRHANVEFQMLSRKWKSMMKGVRNTTSLQYCVREVTNRTFLSDAKAVFERIWKQLLLFLQDKRQEYPRFSFVSDRELLFILAGSTLSLCQQNQENSCQLNSVVTKCFEYINRVALKTSPILRKISIPKLKPTTPQKSFRVSTSKADLFDYPEDYAEIEQTEIYAIYGKNEESVQLNSNVKITQRPEEWMKELAKVIRRTMKDGLRILTSEDSNLLAYYLHSKSHSDKSRELLHGLIDLWPLQLIVLSIRIFFTLEVTKWVSNSETFEEVLGHMKSNVEVCISELQQSASPTRHQELSTITLCFLNNINILRRLKSSKQTGFDWSLMLQYRWRSDTQSCLVTHGVKTYDYGYEYLGPYSAIALTPLTERMMWNMSMAFRLHSGAFLYGETGVSKQATIRELVQSIGVLCVIYDCSIQLNLHQLGRILRGLIQCQAYLSVVGLEHVDSEIFQLFVNQIKRIQQALKTHKEKIYLDGYLVGLQTHHTYHQNFGIICKLTAISESRASSMLNLCASAFLPVACQFSLPDATIIIKVYFASMGFIQVDRLAKLLHSFLLLLRSMYGSSSEELLSIRTIRKIVDLVRIYSEMDEEQIVAYSVWYSIGSRIAPDHKREVLALLHSIFCFHFVELDITKTKQYIHEQMENKMLAQTPIALKKVAELHHLKSNYAINIVTGAMSTGKSTTIELLGSLKKSGDGEPRAKCFRIAVSTLGTTEFYGHVTYV